MMSAENAMAEMLEKQVAILASEGFFETAEEAANRAQMFRLLDKQEKSEDGTHAFRF